MPGKFTNPEAIRLRLQGFAGDCVLALEVGLPQESLDSMEALLLPPATKEQRLSAIEEAKLVLTKAGVAVDDIAVQALEAEVVKATAGAAPKKEIKA